MQASASDGDASSVDKQSSDYYSSRGSRSMLADSSEDSDNSQSRYDAVAHWTIRRLSRQSSPWSSFSASDAGSDGSTTTTTPEVVLTRSWTTLSSKKKRSTAPSFKWTCVTLAVGFVFGWLATGSGLLPSASSSSSSPSAAAKIANANATANATDDDASKGGRLSQLLPSKPIDFSPDDFAWIKPDALAVFGVEKPPPHKGWPAVEQCKKDVKTRARSLKAVWHPEKTRHVRRNVDVMLAPWQLDLIFNKICDLESVSVTMCGGTPPAGAGGQSDGAGGKNHGDGPSKVDIDEIVGRDKVYAHNLRENKADHIKAADIEFMSNKFAKHVEREQEKEREEERERATKAEK